jgi:hypothetical protein
MIALSVKFVIFFVRLKVLKTCVWYQDLQEMARKFILHSLILKQFNKQPWLLILFKDTDCIEMMFKVYSLVMHKEKTKIEQQSVGTASEVVQTKNNLIRIAVVEIVKQDKKNKIG